MQINGANATIRLQCVTWDSLEFIVVDQQSNRSSSTVERMFVRTFMNGCRPRYECIQFHLAAPGVLLYRRSRYRLWPFNGTTGIIVDCRSLFTYDEVGYQLLVSTSGLQTRCRLPADVVNAELSVELKSGLRCRGVIRIGSALITSFKLLLRDCPQGHDSEQIYRCLDSIRQYNEHGVKTGDSVVVSADSADGDLLCWWFGHTHPTRIFLLTAAACYDARMMETIQPLAIFIRPNSTSGPASGVVTSTSVSAPCRELSESEINPVTVAKNGSKNAVLYRRLLETLISVAVVSVMC